MSVYNIYFMNVRGHIDRIEHVEAAGDEAAIDAARGYQGKQPLEIWCEHRKIHRIEALDEAQARGSRSGERSGEQQPA